MSLPGISVLPPLISNISAHDSLPVICTCLFSPLASHGEETVKGGEGCC